MAGVTEAGVRVAAVVGERQDTVHGKLARRESAIAVVDLAADVRRGVTRRIRVHARYVWRDYQ